jgi:S-DNA-T family DNA segregation ATPase FtsK/SpoIIIE
MKVKSNKTSSAYSVGLGVVFMVSSILLSLMMLSYSPNDPSFNNASSSVPINFLGIPGAYISDLLFQVFGFASLLIVSVLFSLGLHNILKIPVKLMWLRSISLMLALCVGSLVLSKYIQNSEGPFASYGGAIGNVLSIYTLNINTEYLIYILSSAFVVLAYFSLGISIKSCYAFFVFTFSQIAKAISVVLRGLNTVGSGIKHIWEFVSKKRGSPEILEEDAQYIPARPQQEMSISSEPKITPKKSSPPQKAKFNFSFNKNGNFKVPSVDLLNPFKKSKSTYSDAELRQQADDLIKVLNDFGVRGEITSCSPGPVVTLFEFEPIAGTKSSRVIGLADDIARTMRAVSTRISVIPGKNSLGIELPNRTREMVYIRGLVDSDEYKENTHKLPLILGRDIGGNNIVADLAAMPHLLVAGTTGSGKSVAINTMILSLLYKYTPEECKLVMIDPKMLELSIYQNIPHLLAPVVTDSSKAVNALKWVVQEMEGRYKLISQLKVRNIASYNDSIQEAIDKDIDLTHTVQTGIDPETKEPIMETAEIEKKKLPYIVVVVDEMADLMVVAGKEIESSVQRLAQMARAAGIHLIMATQRPSVDVITGVVKANFPTRISFQVISKIDSRTILGEPGAEQLLGKGDMLYMSGGNRIKRVHGPFVDDKEVEKVVAYWKSQGRPTYAEDITEEKSQDMAMGGGEKDDLYDQAVELIMRERKVSTSYLQRYFRIGYNRAATLVEQLEKNSVVGSPNHVGKREILINE